MCDGLFFVKAVGEVNVMQPLTILVRITVNRLPGTIGLSTAFRTALTFFSEICLHLFLALTRLLHKNKKQWKSRDSTDCYYACLKSVNLSKRTETTAHHGVVFRPDARHFASPLRNNASSRPVSSLVYFRSNGHFTLMCKCDVSNQIMCGICMNSALYWHLFYEIK